MKLSIFLYVYDEKGTRYLDLKKSKGAKTSFTYEFRKALPNFMFYQSFSYYNLYIAPTVYDKSIRFSLREF